MNAIRTIAYIIGFLIVSAVMLIIAGLLIFALFLVLAVLASIL